MILRLGDFGDAVKGLQRDLNRLGSILLVDGDFGPGTRDAVADARVQLQRPGPPEADEQLQNAIAAVPDPFPLLTAAGATFIARLEVTSPQLYRRRYCHPTWPSEESGITIGIGYDLKFVTSADFKADWADILPAATLTRLATVVDASASAARLEAVRDLNVPLFDAMKVFLRRSLPTYLERARSIYPQVTSLSPARRTALVSLVYNRGTKLDGDSRREMRAIRDLLAAGDLDAIASQFDSMTRLWDPDKLGGLIQRRHDEAKLWRSGFAALQLDADKAVIADV